MRYLVTGGAGFIGSAFVRLTLDTVGAAEVLALDALTYAGNLENLAAAAGRPNYRFERVDIRDGAAVRAGFERFRPDVVVHFAAESHVDRSILSPEEAMATNFMGTGVLLEAAREFRPRRFMHISTDEVYGSIEPPAEADESYPLIASSPYSASKAGADLLALAYYATFGLPVIVTRASNNYGPYQFPEKLIPLMISNAFDGKPLPIYGDGRQVRDWLFVDDHCRAIHAAIDRGRAGQIYNVGGNCALPNLEVVKRLLRAAGKPESLMTAVADRPGHDRRYALSSAKIEAETGWKPQVDFDDGLAVTVAWYRNNRAWIDRVRSGEYRSYYEKNYGNR